MGVILPTCAVYRTRSEKAFSSSNPQKLQHRSTPSGPTDFGPSSWPRLWPFIVWIILNSSFMKRCRGFLQYPARPSCRKRQQQAVHPEVLMPRQQAAENRSQRVTKISWRYIYIYIWASIARYPPPTLHPMVMGLYSSAPVPPSPPVVWVVWVVVVVEEVVYVCIWMYMYGMNVYF